MTEWCDTNALSAATGLSVQQVRNICRAAYGFRQPIEIRSLHDRGGRSGSQYAIKVASLPPHIQERLKALQSSNEAVSNLRFGDEAQFERNWKYDVIRAAASFPKGSSERKTEIERLHHTTRIDWTGVPRLLTKSTLYKWIEVYEATGIHGLSQRIRSDKGVKKVLVSREWSNAVPFSDEIKAAIHETLKLFVRGLWKGDGTPKIIGVLASDKLREITAAYGFRTDQEWIFSIPQQFIWEEEHYRAVARHQKDRKASEDNKPRIRRTTAGLEPMEVVVMDVHHINVLVEREDGSTATPKLLAFHDLATSRVFCEIVFFEGRGGVRNSDVITAFVNMCQDPAFGLPQTLYCDNGSEYRFADYLEDALKLGTKVVGFDDRKERNRVVRALPYNASAKHVEGWFRQMNQQYFRHIQGWIDDDRMNPKGPELGKLPKPYSEGFDSLCATIYGYLTAYEHMPQKGALKGKSPAITFKKHVANGWKATVLDADRLLTVFTDPVTRVVRKHGIELRGAAWTCDGLLAFFERTVIAHVPKYHGFSELLITDERGQEIGVAVADREFDVLDERGAKESARRTGIRNKAIRQLAKSAPDIDVGAELLAYGQRQISTQPNEPDAVVSVNRSHSPGRAKLPVAAPKTSRQQADDELRRQNDRFYQLAEAIRTGKGIS